MMSLGIAPNHAFMPPATCAATSGEIAATTPRQRIARVACGRDFKASKSAAPADKVAYRNVEAFPGKAAFRGDCPTGANGRTAADMRQVGCTIEQHIKITHHVYLVPQRSDWR